MKCKWRGYETELVSVPHETIRSATQSVCPACGCDSYMHMTEREITAWKKSQTGTQPALPAQGHDKGGEDADQA